MDVHKKDSQLCVLAQDAELMVRSGLGVWASLWTDALF